MEFLRVLKQSAFEYGEHGAAYITKDAEDLLRRAGVSLNLPVSKVKLAETIFTYTRSRELVGGTMNKVVHLREFARKQFGDEVFNKCYQGLITDRGRSYFLPEKPDEKGVEQEQGKKFEKIHGGEVYATEVFLDNPNAEPGTAGWVMRYSLKCFEKAANGLQRIHAYYVKGIVDEYGNWIADFPEPTEGKPTKFV